MTDKINGVPVDVTRPLVPDVVPLVRAYYRNHGYPNARMHVVIEDRNLDDRSIQWMLDRAIEHGDREAAQIALLLLKMSKAQRKRVAAMSGPPHGPVTPLPVLPTSSPQDVFPAQWNRTMIVPVVGEIDDGE